MEELGTGSNHCSKSISLDVLASDVSDGEIDHIFKMSFVKDEREGRDFLCE